MMERFALWMGCGLSLFIFLYNQYQQYLDFPDIFIDFWLWNLVSTIAAFTMFFGVVFKHQKVVLWGICVMAVVTLLSQLYKLVMFFRGEIAFSAGDYVHLMVVLGFVLCAFFVLPGWDMFQERRQRQGPRQQHQE